MGNFLDDIQKAKANRYASKQKVIDEIVNYFKDEINKPEFENKLKNRIIESVNMDRVPWVEVRYWRHHDGCSPTHFGMTFCKDFHGNQHDGDCHDDIALYDIRYDVVRQLCEVYEEKLRSLGLMYSRTCKTGGLDYPEYKYDIIV